MPTGTEQHGITGAVAVFHRQTAGPVQPTLSQGSARRISGARDAEAQSRGVGPKAGPRGEQASFTVINEGDVGGARRVLAVVQQGVGMECV